MCRPSFLGPAGASNLYRCPAWSDSQEGISLLSAQLDIRSKINGYVNSFDCLLETILTDILIVIMLEHCFSLLNQYTKYRVCLVTAKKTTKKSPQETEKVIVNKPFVAVVFCINTLTATIIPIGAWNFE